MNQFPTFAAERAAVTEIWPLLGVRRTRLALAVLLGAGSLAAGVALTATSAYLIARASQMPYVLSLTVAAVSVRMFGIARPVLRYLERLASHRVALSGMASLRAGIYDRLSQSPSNEVAQLRRGDVLGRTGADVDAVGDLVVRALLPVLVAGAVGGVAVAILASWLPWAGLVLALGLVVAGVGGPLLALRSARRAEYHRQAAAREMTALLQDSLAGAAEVLVGSQLPAVQHRRDQLENELAQVADDAARPAAFATALDTVALGATVLGCLLVGIPAVTNGSLPAVGLAVLALTPFAAFEAVAGLPAAAVQWVRSAGAAARINALLPTDSVAAPPSEARPSASVLQARDLAVGWSTDKPVLTGVELEVAPGRAVAIVGPSGSGKTTLLATLAGLLPSRAGRVELGGVAPHELPRTVAATHVTFTAEDAHIFATTLFENLRVANGALSRPQATELLTAAGLGPWLAGLPDGLDTHLGSDAVSVSGGERRRVLLARALASPAPLLLIDEPGEHLEPETAARLVSDLLATSRAGRGVVVATHQLRALAAADEILVLSPTAEGTTVTARGTHAQLLANCPAYRDAVEGEQA
ncbi:thiol reductant ABC exporter subunit CydC [Buchananella hordeovulneris]|uniref:thiol reductant ABC exporter subunit CydC n=1 Tax=Buchananella hordeovulneris TaxID=52770 RepID=UPI000F5F1B07|nr:thiol reductant ABC exporter subunit CydC [Buchananella hordeovulneris]MDO5081493.1 thiol reductant ABC exporter subunit CydC [Buchananella hordeovulneris]RRD44121.1 thiol reductant ABC exporter subunit CydC [Buchananella hordeovulneris]RRD53682.1 thiol reductant ABC exporter subunit CydC [Buchananella hordeovulneris]